MSLRDRCSNLIPYVQRVDRLLELISVLYAPCRFGEQKVIKEIQTQERKQLALLSLEGPLTPPRKVFPSLPWGILALPEGYRFKHNM